jgi:crotonobetainyl-CoA:carnitine CoA-transferase CaiB-like acyl-CoA transferase
VTKPGAAPGPLDGVPVAELERYFTARGAVVAVRHPVVEEPPLHVSSAKPGGTPGRIERTAPCLEEHNGSIFRGLLGLTEDEYRTRETAGPSGKGAPFYLPRPSASAMINA